MKGSVGTSTSLVETTDEVSLIGIRQRQRFADGSVYVRSLHPEKVADWAKKAGRLGSLLQLYSKYETYWSWVRFMAETAIGHEEREKYAYWQHLANLCLEKIREEMKTRKVKCPSP